MNGVLRTILSYKSRLAVFFIGPVFLVYAGSCFAQDTLSGETEQAMLAANSNFSLKLSGDFISGCVNNVPMRHVFHELSSLTKIKVMLSDKIKPTKITACFESVSLENALRSLLVDSSYVLVYDGKGDNARITGVYVLPPGMSRVPAGAAAGNGEQSRVLTNALKSTSIPANIKAALLHQTAPEQLKNNVRLRSQAIYKLLEHLEAAGDAKSETIHRLRTDYELQKIRQ